MSLELVWKTVLTEKKYKIFLPILYFFSLIFKFFLRVRHFFYEVGFFKTTAVPAVVVSVGNIVVGGSGKTPFVLFLVKELEKRAQVAILTRGYRSELEHQRIPQKARDFFHDPKAWEIIGDEPFLFCQKLKSKIWVGKNRLSSAELSVKEGAEILVLDDGMQYRKLKKDYEIVLVEAASPLADRFLLPRGHLRELPSRLTVADLIVLRGKDSAVFEKAREELSVWTSAPCIGMSAEITVPEGIRKVGVFCGIANPSRFIEELKLKEVDVVETFILGDHQNISIEALKIFARKAKIKGAEALFCTEKDRVKILEIFEMENLPIFSIPLELKIIYNPEAWNKFIEKIQ